MPGWPSSRGSDPAPGRPSPRRRGHAVPNPSRVPAAPAADRGLPRVVSRVPTRDKVVFLTYDDGAETDPRFAETVRALRLPVSIFLTDRVAGPGYAHLARLRSVGVSLQNHTLDHLALRGLPYAGQRAEICGQQDKLTARFGVRPRLLRPPYGTYDTTTLRAAADCGISAVVLWRAAMTADGELTYAGAEHRLGPGDVVAVAAGEGTGPTVGERTARLLREARGRGLRVARLEDYV
ncbi:polysaccharide deacetylase family protein [Streptomyces sp. NPDC020996]|uniref:polysaccharide deacetylase family protein n=1 Tax=Streptomyces sp. NPDC020996 TaxID=3154791 RepID=UPI0033D44710